MLQLILESNSSLDFIFCENTVRESCNRWYAVRIMECPEFIQSSFRNYRQLPARKELYEIAVRRNVSDWEHGNRYKFAGATGGSILHITPILVNYHGIWIRGSKKVDFDMWQQNFWRENLDLNLLEGHFTDRILKFISTVTLKFNWTSRPKNPLLSPLLSPFKLVSSPSKKSQKACH